MKKIFEKLKKFCVKNHISVILVSLCILLLIAGTAVLMASGATKAIEDVYVGDMVKSYNASTGKVESKRVLQTFQNEVDELVTISTSDGQQITATPGHKFYANNDWVSAEDLRAGDVLVNVNGEKVIVEQVQHEILDSPVKVYNFEVEDNHTYFVGNDNGIVVHNRACSAKTVNQMNEQIKRGQAPKGVERIDLGNPKQFEKVHAHIKNSKTAINIDGTFKHGDGKGLTKQIIDWLKSYGWKL